MHRFKITFLTVRHQKTFHYPPQPPLDPSPKSHKSSGTLHPTSLEMKTSCNMGLIIVVTGCFLIASMSSGVLSYPMQSDGTHELQFQQHPQEMEGKDPEQQPPSSSLDELRMRLYLLSWLQSLSQDPSLNERIKAKRTCFVNAGLSHSCDYKNALAAVDEGRFFTSDQSPGK